MAGRKLMEEIGGIYPVDGMNEAGLRARSHLKPEELSDLWSRVAVEALRFRRRMPAPIRALPLLRLDRGLWKLLGYLYDIGFTRDVWMHRVDLSRAIGRTFDATAQHDGRIVADIIAEWATTHTDPFTSSPVLPAGPMSATQPTPVTASKWTPSTPVASSRVAVLQSASSITHYSCSCTARRRCEMSTPNGGEGSTLVAKRAHGSARRGGLERQEPLVLDEIAADDYVELDPFPGQALRRDGLRAFLETEMFPAFPISNG